MLGIATKAAGKAPEKAPARLAEFPSVRAAEGKLAALHAESAAMQKELAAAEQALRATDAAESLREQAKNFLADGVFDLKDAARVPLREKLAALLAKNVVLKEAVRMQLDRVQSVKNDAGAQLRAAAEPALGAALNQMLHHLHKAAEGQGDVEAILGGLEAQGVSVAGVGTWGCARDNPAAKMGPPRNDDRTSDGDLARFEMELLGRD